MKIGLIGCGNMGEAILSGITKGEVTSKENIFIYEKNKERENYIGKKYGIKTYNSVSAQNIFEYSNYIILAVKPNIYPLILEELKDSVVDKVIISIAAGVTISQIEKIIGKDKKIIRTMPNTPALIGTGMTSISPNNNVSDEEFENVKKIFESFGEIEKVEEKLIDAVIAVSGSSPAYVYMMIEAMADGAVLGGLSREKAYKFAAQAVMGAAKMVLNTGEHPGKLKDNVCSPGGTTIEAVAELEKRGFKASIIEAMKKCMQKSQKMSKE